jgi:hypothetical protein
MVQETISRSSQGGMSRVLATASGFLTIGIVAANAVMWSVPELAQYPAHGM